MTKGKQGLANVNPDKVRAIASMGGKAAHKKGTAHKFTSEEARSAGKIGGVSKGKKLKKKSIKGLE